jgi:hypothetical protein
MKVRLRVRNLDGYSTGIDEFAGDIPPEGLRQLQRLARIATEHDLLEVVDLWWWPCTWSNFRGEPQEEVQTTRIVTDGTQVWWLGAAAEAAYCWSTEGVELDDLKKGKDLDRVTAEAADEEV